MTQVNSVINLELLIILYSLLNFIFNWKIILYNIVLVSAVQQHESVISIHIPLPLEPSSHSSSHPSMLSHSTKLSSLYYTATSHMSILHMVVYMSVLHSQFIAPSPYTPVSTYVSLFLPCK